MPTEGLLSICRMPGHLMAGGLRPQPLLSTSLATAARLETVGAMVGCAWRAALAGAAEAMVLEDDSDVDLRAVGAAALLSVAAACSAALLWPVLVPPLLKG